MLDAGHGGFGRRAQSGIDCQCTQEAGINLKIATASAKRGWKTAGRSGGDDPFATKRPLAEHERSGYGRSGREIISTSGQDVTISIHQNHLRGSGGGGTAGVLCARARQRGEKLAAAIQASHECSGWRSEIAADMPRQRATSISFRIRRGAVLLLWNAASSQVRRRRQLLMNEDSYQILSGGRPSSDGYAELFGRRRADSAGGDDGYEEVAGCLRTIPRAEPRMKHPLVLGIYWRYGLRSDMSGHGLCVARMAAG